MTDFKIYYPFLNSFMKFTVQQAIRPKNEMLISSTHNAKTIKKTDKNFIYNLKSQMIFLKTHIQTLTFSTEIGSTSAFLGIKKIV